MPETTSLGRSRSLILLVSLALAVAACRTPQPLVEPPPIAAAESSAQTRAAILKALSENHYTVESEQAGRIVARYGGTRWNMVVAIDYSNRVAVRYVSSENLDYHLYSATNSFVEKGTPVIHPGYNRRVEQLAKVIGTEIAMAGGGDELPPVAAPPPGKAQPR